MLSQTAAVAEAVEVAVVVSIMSTSLVHPCGCSSSGAQCPFVMSFLFTRAQWKHLALDGLGRELVRNVADVGAEVGVLCAWEA